MKASSWGLDSRKFYQTDCACKTINVLWACFPLVSCTTYNMWLQAVPRSRLCSPLSPTIALPLASHTSRD
eukprot:6482266-Amphidinium_carterae.1